MIAGVVAIAAIASRSGRALMASAVVTLRGEATVESRLAEMSPSVHAEIRAWCTDAHVAWPPADVVLLADKSERTLHVLARGDGPWVRLTALPILGASGNLGPKLREGDGQVPEGVYAVESLHPNSMFHLALRLGYPNDFDREKGRIDGRTALGGDIMMHGGSASVGCLAMGNDAIERIFAITAAVGSGRTRAIIVPCDLRAADRPLLPTDPPWIGELYERLERELDALPAPL